MCVFACAMRNGKQHASVPVAVCLCIKSMIRWPCHAGACFYAFDDSDQELHVLMVHKVKQRKARDTGTPAGTGAVQGARGSNRSHRDQPAKGNGRAQAGGSQEGGRDTAPGHPTSGDTVQQQQQPRQRHPQQQQRQRLQEEAQQPSDLASAMQALTLSPQPTLPTQPQLIIEWNLPGVMCSAMQCWQSSKHQQAHQISTELLSVHASTLALSCTIGGLLLAGGKAKQGELPVDTAAREIEEETHWQLAAADVRPLLSMTSMQYVPESKYVLGRPLPHIMFLRKAWPTSVSRRNPQQCQLI